MALFFCVECKQKISDSAIFCPHCGCVYQRVWLEKSERYWQLAAIINALIWTVIISFQTNNGVSIKELYGYMFIGGSASLIFLLYGWATSRLELKSK